MSRNMITWLFAAGPLLGWTCSCGYINGDHRTTCAGCGQ